MNQTAVGMRVQFKQPRIAFRSRRGVAELLSTLMAVPVFAIFISLLLYFGNALYARAAIEDAAIAGSRFAVTSLSGDQGCEQARDVIAQVLKGYGADRKAVSWLVAPLDHNYKRARTRDDKIQIEMSYEVDQRDVPIFGELLGNYTAQTNYVLIVDRNTNRYWNGWKPCYAQRKKIVQPN